MTIDIICPLYEAEKYIADLHRSFLVQKNVDISNIRYVLTESKDETEGVLLKLDRCVYSKIAKKDFSHPLTREREAFKSTADIIVFVTQDVKITDDDWLYNLTNPIEKGQCEASFSRQICDNNSIEKYIREKNYPKQSRIVTKDSLDSLGLNTFFFSDVSSAVKRELFIELNGYDHKDFAINEDMYFAYKLIMNGYRIKYCSESRVIHYHNYTLKQLYDRYYMIGTFFRENEYFEEFGTNRSGVSLAKFILERAIQEKNIRVLLQWLPNMCARYLGMKNGKNNRIIHN